MWGKHNVGRLPKGTPIFKRLVLIHVQGRARDLPVVKRLSERRLVDDTAARHVHDEHTVFHASKRFRGDQATGVVGERDVKGDHISLLDDIVERCTAYAQTGSTLRGQVRIMRHDLHAKGCTSAGHLTADPSGAD